jgi:hypothetical protein
MNTEVYLFENKSIERVCRHLNLILEMVPTFDDELLLKIFDAVHIFEDKNNNKPHS